MIFNVHFDDQKHVGAWIDGESKLWIFDYNWEAQVVADCTGVGTDVASGTVSKVYDLPIEECLKLSQTGEPLERAVAFYRVLAERNSFYSTVHHDELASNSRSECLRHACKTNQMLDC